MSRGGAFAHPAGLICGAFEQLFGTGGRESDCQIWLPGEGGEAGDVEVTNN